MKRNLILLLSLSLIVLHPALAFADTAGMIASDSEADPSLNSPDEASYGAFEEPVEEEKEEVHFALLGESNPDTTVDQYYNVSQDGETSFTDVKMVKVDWETTALAISYKSSKKWDPNQRKWVNADTDDPTINGGNAIFTLTNYSSVPVTAVLDFTVDEKAAEYYDYISYIGGDKADLSTPVTHTTEDLVYADEDFTALSKKIEAQLKVKITDKNSLKKIEKCRFGSYTIQICDKHEAVEPVSGFSSKLKQASVITFSSKAPAVYEEGTVTDISKDGNGSLLLYKNGSEFTIAPKETGAAILAPEDCTLLFYSFTSLTRICFDNFDLSNTSTVKSMLQGCSSLKVVNVTSFDTSNITVFNRMFRDCSALESLDLSSFDTANSVDDEYMLHNCTSMKELLISNRWTLNSKSKGHAFYNFAAKVINVDNP